MLLHDYASFLYQDGVYYDSDDLGQRPLELFVSIEWRRSSVCLIIRLAYLFLAHLSTKCSSELL